MKTKLLNSSVSFVSVLGSLSLLLLTAPDITAVCVCAAVFPLFAAAGFYLYRNLKPLKILKIISSALSFISASFSLAFSARLVTESKILNADYFPLILVLSALFSLCFAMSGPNSAKSVTFICSLIATAALGVILLLSAVDTGFSLPEAVMPDFKNMLVPAAVCFADIILLSPLCKTKTFVPYAMGGLAAFGLFITVIMLCLSVLTNDVYYALEMPLLKLWQSTYIASFVNRFEVVNLCAVYLVCAVKSGLLLSCALRCTDKKSVPLFTLLLLYLSAAFSFLKIY